jgi:hypothetical protein
MSDNALAERKIDHEIADTIAVGKGGIDFQNASQIMEFAKLMAASQSAVPKHLRGQPGACLGILDDAIRFRINPYALARHSYFVNDQLSYTAAVFAAIVNAHAPLKQRPEIRFEGEGQEMQAIVTGVFRDGAVREYKSPHIADIQPKNSPLWKSDPGQQLSYYSLRAFARRWCPEIILGVYDADELRDAAMTDVTPKAEPRTEAPQKAIPRSLDEFADMPLDKEGGDAANNAASVLDDFATGSSPPSGSPAPQTRLPDEPAAAGEVEATASPAPSLTKAEAIERILRLASDEDLEPQERAEELENLKAIYEADGRLDAGFIAALFSMAGKVARGEHKLAAAKKYLEAL